jgi:positive regulator of sigma E activity
MSTVIFDPRKKKEEEVEEEGKSVPQTPRELLVVTLTVATIPLIFMILWNWLIPSIFGLATIGYFKSAGLLAMSYMIFKK